MVAAHGKETDDLKIKDYSKNMFGLAIFKQTVTLRWNYDLCFPADTDDLDTFTFIMKHEPRGCVFISFSGILKELILNTKKYEK